MPIGQVGKGRKINSVFGEALEVLGHTEFFEPVRNLLHNVAPERATSTSREFSNTPVAGVAVLGTGAMSEGGRCCLKNCRN